MRNLTLGGIQGYFHVPGQLQGSPWSCAQFCLAPKPEVVTTGCLCSLEISYSEVPLNVSFGLLKWCSTPYRQMSPFPLSIMHCFQSLLSFIIVSTPHFKLPHQLETSSHYQTNCKAFRNHGLFHFLKHATFALKTSKMNASVILVTTRRYEETSPGWRGEKLIVSGFILSS